MMTIATAPAARALSVALAGNPNAGKTTLFNALTGARQHVGNWPGKTVEKKTGALVRDALRLDITDLPGAYSLSAYSLEEVVARDFILNERPDVVVAVFDAVNADACYTHTATCWRNPSILAQMRAVVCPATCHLIAFRHHIFGNDLDIGKGDQHGAFHKHRYQFWRD